MKSIYTYYKERLIEISGKNRSIYTRSFSKKTGYDLGRLLARDTNREDAFVRFLWSDGREPFDLFSSGDKTLRKIFDSDAEEKRARRELETQGLTGDEKDRAVLRLERQARQAFNANVDKEVTAVRTLKREAEDIEKETGRYELFVGYPFVYGGTRDFLFKAPLLFFPVEVDAEEDTKVTLRLKRGESVRLDILVENMGRVNYGRKLRDEKGLTGGVRLGQRYHFGWSMTPMPLDDLAGLRYAPWETGVDAPTFLRGRFPVTDPADTFLRLDGFTKGVAFINGFNLGRYWNPAGPQKTLYLPAPLLRAGENELVIFELEHSEGNRVLLTDTPDLG